MYGIRRLLLLVCVAAWLIPCALPQASTGKVSGTVRDQTGGVIPGTQITLTNTETNGASATQTNEVGFYVFPSVMPGPYRLAVSSPGMQKYEGLITVSVSQSAVIDPVLKPGLTGTVVDVLDVTPMLTVDNATVRTEMERSRIEQLPINGRSLNSLMQTQPGFEAKRTFGAPEGSQEWLLDGSAETDRRWADNPHDFAPALDAIQEFSVESNAISAKLSRPVNIVIVTKSGTNQLHGTAFETLRNNAIGLARSRTDYYTKAPPLNRNEFGASAGAPVIIPKLYNGKDRTFWFFNYEGRIQRQSTTASYTVPTAAMRQGDMSGLIDSQGRLQTLYDPWTTNTTPQNWSRQPFSYGGKLNAIDPARMSPVAKYMFDQIPLPTDGTNPVLGANWWGPQRTTNDNWGTTTRIDHSFSDRSRIYTRFNVSRTLGKNREYNGTMQILNGVAGWEDFDVPDKSIAVNYFHTFSGTFFNEVLVSAHRGIWTGTQGGTEDIDWSAKLGLPNPFNSHQWPILNSAGFGNYAVNDFKRNFQTFGILDDNATKIVGKHELQFGFHRRLDQLNILPQQRYPQPTVNYATTATALYDKVGSTPTNPLATSYTGHNMANFFLGLATYTNTLSHGMYYLRGGETALYFQDNYKMTRRLTVNLGLRWEYWPAFTDKNNIAVGFDPKTKSIVTGTDLNTMYVLGMTLPSIVNAYKALGLKFETAQEAGLPQALMNPRKANFGPRVGFAYKALDGKMGFVMRGGYSLSYFHPQLSGWLDNFNYSTPMRADFNYNLNDQTQAPDGLARYMMRSIPQFVAGLNTGGTNVIDLNQPRGITRGTAQTTYWDPNLPDSRTHSVNFTLEKEVMAATVVRAGYIGTFGRKLAQNYEYNNGTPDYIWYVTTGLPTPTGEYSSVARRPFESTVLGTIREYKRTGWNNYNGISLELERRLNKGIAFQVSYVMGNAFAATGTVPGVNQFLPGAVPTNYDELNRYINYSREGLPKHRVRWNWLLELPFGKGQLIGRNAGGVLNRFIGGWQLAGLGQLASNTWSLGTGNWNITGVPIKIYGLSNPIQDCNSGTCYPGYLYWNGYLPSNKINSVDASGKPNGYMGIPADYKPAVMPLIPWGSTTLPANAPSNTVISTYWDSNNVWVPLTNSTVQRLGYAPGLHPWRNIQMPGVRTWGLDASLFKTIPVNERFSFRLNADFFNVLNRPGTPTGVSGSSGILSTRSSQQSPRVVQLSLRLTY